LSLRRSRQPRRGQPWRSKSRGTKSLPSVGHRSGTCSTDRIQERGIQDNC